MRQYEVPPHATAPANERLHPALPRRELFDLTRSLIRGETRSLRRDTSAMIAQLPEAPYIHGLTHVPSSGPVCLMANHYQRRGLWIGWGGSAITWAVGQARADDPPLHWLVTADCRISRSDHAVPATAWLFRRVAQVWGMIPLPLGAAAVLGRTQAVRRMLTLLGQDRAVGMFPEGHDGHAGPPGLALSGAAPLLAHLAERGIPVVPVAIRECEPTLGVAFGAPLAPHEDDVMTPIRVLYNRLGGA